MGRSVAGVIGVLLMASLLIGVLWFAGGLRYDVSNTRASAPWPLFHQNPHSTGLSPYSLFQGTPREVWRIYINDTAGLTTSIAIAEDGTIYAPGDGIYAISPDGELKWYYPESPRSGIALDSNGRIYFAASIPGNYTATKLVCIDTTGNYLWNLTVDDIITTSPIFANSTVYFGTLHGSLYAVNPDGCVKWIYNNGLSDPARRIYGTPVVGNDGTIFFPSYNYYFFAVNPDGTLKWRIEPGYSTCDTSPVIGYNGVIYVAANVWDGEWHKNVYAISQSGSNLGKSPDVAKDGTNWYIVPAISRDNRIYVVNSDVIVAFDENLTQLWKIDHGGVPYRSVISLDNDGTLIVSDTTYLYAIAPDSSLKWSYRILDYTSYASVPAIDSQGRVLLIWDKNLTCIGSADIPEMIPDYVPLLLIVIMLPVALRKRL